MEKQFFMVYAEGQGAPTYKHENEQAASKEAERLAEKLGVNTTVLQAVKNGCPEGHYQARKDLRGRLRGAWH